MSRTRQKRKARSKAEQAEAIKADLATPEVLEALEAEALCAEIAEDEQAQSDAESEGLLPRERLVTVIESLLFACDRPLTAARLRQLIHEPTAGRIKEILAELVEFYADRGIVLHEVSGGFQFRTQPASSEFVQKLVAGRPVRLTRAQLDTLAIIAYRQPITRPEIDDIRGVDSGGTLKVLADRSLIRVLGKKEEPGRPLLYGTTTTFLDFFSLSDLRDLPTLREYHELSEDSIRVVEEKLGPDEQLAQEPHGSDEQLVQEPHGSDEELAQEPHGSDEQPPVEVESKDADDLPTAEGIDASMAGADGAGSGPGEESDPEFEQGDDGEPEFAEGTLGSGPTEETLTTAQARIPEPAEPAEAGDALTEAAEVAPASAEPTDDVGTEA